MSGGHDQVHDQVDDADACGRCGGSGRRADGMPWLTPEEREMMDSTRCLECFGTGRADGEGRIRAHD